MSHVPRRASTVLLTACVVAATISSTATATVSTGSSVAPTELGPLVSAVAERLSTADAVAAAKWGTGKPIDDPAREAEVLRAVAEQGRRENLDPSRVEQVFRDQIEASKDVQRGLFAYWSAVPQAVPEPRPDLASVWPVLDRLNVEIVAQMSTHRRVLAGPGCLPDLLEGAVDVVASGRPDGLHQAGLARALRSVCGAVSG